MFKSFATLAFLLTLTSACGTAQTHSTSQTSLQETYPAETWDHWEAPEAAGFDSARLESIGDHLDSLNSASIMVVRGGRVVYEFGDNTEVFYVASVRKSILAMLYGPYVGDGTIDLNRTLAEMGMDDVQNLTDAEQQATIEHLITARSGVYHPASNPGDNLDDAPPRGSQPPGTYFLYSNWDFNAAGAAFEHETGLNIFDALEQDLAEPLDFQDWNRSIHEKGGDFTRSRYPSYHMRLSGRDMARLGLLMLREGQWNGEHVLPSDWARWIVSLTTPLEDMNPSYIRETGLGYGAMWWVWDDSDATGSYEGAYSARGAYGQYITVLPALDLVVSHKTRPMAYDTIEQYSRQSVSWEEFQGVLDRLVAAFCGMECDD